METSNIIPPHEPARPKEEISVGMFEEYENTFNGEGSASNMSWRNLEGEGNGHCNVTVGEFFAKEVVGRVGEGR